MTTSKRLALAKEVATINAIEKIAAVETLEKQNPVSIRNGTVILWFGRIYPLYEREFKNCVETDGQYGLGDTIKSNL